MAALDFRMLRSDAGGQADAFEEFSAQIFRNLDLKGRAAKFERYRGAGGDGGVEAVWRFDDGSVTGLQAKFFLPLKASHKAQLVDSFNEALANHPGLDRYIVTFPFDPTPTVKARKGTGEQDKLNEWKSDLEALARAQGRTVAIEWWFATELKDRLLALPNADGRLVYWFGAAVLGNAAVKARIKTARDIAGPRYSPVLKVGTPADEFIAAAGALHRWFAASAEHRVALAEARNRWSGKDADDIPQIAEIRTAFDEALLLTRSWGDGQFEEARRLRLVELARENESLAVAAEAHTKAQFDATHGADNDTPSFRQFQAEYNVTFPAGKLDRARDLKQVWRAVLEMAAGPAAQAVCGKPALLIGPAGIGKTHAIIDAAEQRLRDGFCTIPILGEELHAGRDFWSFVASALDLPATASRSEIIGALAAAAERTGRPLLLMIDALNETPSRERWRTWIPEILTALADTPVRLLVACRDVFAEETFGESLANFAVFQHPGFVGNEQSAAVAFATHYGLEPPAEVIAQPEFANPLFLHLLCENARAQGARAIPAGVISLLSLVIALVAAANRRAAPDLDIDHRLSTPVQDGVRALARRMAEVGRSDLPLKEASELLETVHPRTGKARSLLNALETQNLVAIIPAAGGPAVRFTFERLSDMLVADASIAGTDSQGLPSLFANGGRLAHLVVDAASVAANAGVIQALSIVVPERAGSELASHVAAKESRLAVAKLALDVVAWRDPQKIPSANAMTVYFRTGREIIDLLKRAIAISTIPGHPLGTDWLSGFLDTLPIVDRDALWSAALVESWDGKGNAYRLIRLARDEDMSSLSPGPAQALGTALCWFLACADRRVRDGATKGLVRLIMGAPAVAAAMVQRFATTDDDYILERILTAAYGAGLQMRSDDYWKDVGPAVYEAIFDVRGLPSANVLIRDHARLIVEAWCAVQGRRPDPDRSKPVFSSAWPLQTSSSTWDGLRTSHEDFPPNMFIAPAAHSDFGRYIAESKVLSKYDLAAVGLDTETALKWIFEETLRIGYPGPNQWGLAYDHNLHAKHGIGRAKPAYAERLGKKYAWIFLARLAGHLADHAPPARRSWEPAPEADALQATALRSIDPTAGVGATDGEHQVGLDSFLVLPSPRSDHLDDAGWIDAAKEFALNPSAGGWTLLHLDYPGRLDDPLAERALTNREFRRTENAHVTVFLAATGALTGWKTDQAGHIPDSPTVHDFYIGEYGSTAASRLLMEAWPAEDMMGLSVAPAVIGVASDFNNDASGDETTLSCPSQVLLEAMGARWDGKRSWLDASGGVVATHIKQGTLEGVVARTENLDAALKSKGLSLVWSVFGNRTAKRKDFQGYLDQRRVIVVRRGKPTEVWAKIDRAVSPENV